MAEIFGLKAQWLEEGIVHEAGHILVAKLRGLKVHELSIELYPIGGGLGVKRFATLAERATDEEIPQIDPARKENLMLMIAGGLAAQIFAGKMSTDQGLGHDRSELARFNTDSTLEDLAPKAVPIISEQEPTFRRLVTLIRQRYLEFIKRRDLLQPGMYVLLTKEDIEAVFVQKTDAEETSNSSVPGAEPGSSI